MGLIVKPMLAPNEAYDESRLIFPLLASPKLDGIRCVKQDGKVLSRKFLDIPNHHIRATMAPLPDGLDGELMLGPGGTFNQVQSAVMREEGEPDFRYYVFDYVSTSLEETYEDRMKKLDRLQLPAFCIKVLPNKIVDMDDLNTFEGQALSDGFEGLMLRDPKGPYKCGRATLKQGWLLKMKRFMDSEAVITGFEEQMSNQNEAGEDAFGRTKRSKALDGMVAANTLGKFIATEIGETPWKGKTLKIGGFKGMTAVERKRIWDNQADYLGKILTYKYQPHGVKDLPRLPIGKGFRDPKDM